MARFRHSKGADFNVKKIDGVSRSSEKPLPLQKESSQRVNEDGAISESIIHDLLRSVVVDDTEQVTLADAIYDTDDDGYLPSQHVVQRPLARLIGAVLKRRPNPWTLLPFFVLAFVVVFGLLIISNRGLNVKKQVIEDGQAAVGHLMSARAAVERFDFAAASDDFTRAYEQFGRARDDLGIFNTRLGTILAKLPGGDQIDAAQRVIQAGQLLAGAGGSLSSLVSALAESGAILDPANDGRTSFTAVLLPMQEALSDASQNITAARSLLDEVDITHVPEEQRAEFEELIKRLPELEQLISRGAAYVRFLEDVIAGTGNRTYLLLFQNTSELRPTGGFPGSYGIAIFTDGRLLSFEADDVYNPDGQIDELIVPPRALQHITPGWGLRDSTWFADFPTSARKAMEMYEVGSGRRVDGVLAITPRVIEDLLEIAGPVSMPEYDLVLSADDFLPKLQAQVEYGLDKRENKPKKIIMEMAPIILRKLYQAPEGEWLKVLGVFSQGLKRKDIMMYFPDDRLQEFVHQEAFDGRVHRGDEDFIMVVLANVAGGKADAVTDTAMRLDSSLTSGGVEHALTIVRRHDGGTSDYGFYNTTNPAYIRVLVPNGSTFRSISGNTKKGFRAVVSYANAVYDPDLDALESSAVHLTEHDVTIYEESGRTAFGFWLVVEPGRVREVRLRWTSPPQYADRDYELYVQRQPGLDVQKFEWTVSAGSGARLLTSSPALVPTRDIWRLRTDLETDLSISVSFQ